MDTPTEARPGEKVSWRRVLVALTATLVLLGALAGFFISYANTDTPFFRRLTAASNIVFRDLFPGGEEKEDLFVPVNRGDLATAESPAASSAAPSVTPAPKPPARIPSACAFAGKGGSEADVRVSEIAWMGTPENADAEWVELVNDSSADVSLSGWRLLAADRSLSVQFSSRAAVRGGGLFLLERETDAGLPQLADQIFKGRLSNKGVHLRLLDADCRIVDEVDASHGWNVLGGDTMTKRTAERNLSTGGWRSSLHPGGTPKELPAKEEPSVSPPPATSTSPSIFVSEVMAGREGAASDEFVELFNPGPEAVDLTGWSLKKRSSTGTESALMTAARLEGVIVPPGKHLLLANASYAGPVPADLTWPKSYTLAYKANGVVLYSKSGKADEIFWEEIAAGRSLVRNDILEKGVLSDPGPRNKAGE